MGKHTGEIIEDILLGDLRGKYSMDKSQINIRCPFCGDSSSDRNARSCTVKVATENTPRWLYFCFRANCRAKGHITPDFLRMVDINNYDANIYLNTLNRKVLKGKRFTEKHARYIKNFPSKQDKLSKAKLDYINNRLGLKLDFNDLLRLKIHTNMNELFRLNDVVSPDKKKYLFENLSTHGIGFISTYNDYCVVRNATGSNKITRYTIVDIFDTDDDTDKYKMYNIPTKIDLLSSEPIELIMTEGQFDILSVFYNLEDEDDFNKIYCAISGASYEKIILHYIRQYGLLDLKIKIYSDNDVELDYFKKVYKRIRKYCISLEMIVYYNKLKKDFGVRRKEMDIEENYVA